MMVFTLLSTPREGICMQFYSNSHYKLLNLFDHYYLYIVDLIEGDKISQYRKILSIWEYIQMLFLTASCGILINTN
jgi:hypothetical protein